MKTLKILQLSQSWEKANSIGFMRLLGCLASFQRLMEGVLRDIQNVVIYIDDLLVHTDMHKKHLLVLDQVLT